AKLRVTMRTEIRRIQQEVGITAIYVTHDQSEAMALSDKIIIMNKGVVAQMGTPQEIYYHPVNEFVADFIGEANFLRGEMVGQDGRYATLNVEGYPLNVELRPDMQRGEQYTVVLRPEAAHLAPEGGLPCRVVLSCFMGSYQNYHVMVGDTLVKLEEHDPKNKRIYQVGELCALAFEPESVHVL
ncbi:MAG: ABC transporter ATP-binding protein, partial [Oscillospiraceae bacterium]|nr:ABC transporter ATP-binding protein [Oscillospiraceae bacterium]